MEAYSRGLEPEEREPFLALQSEIEEYWRVLDQTIAWTPDERNQKRDSFFYDELVPRRTAMLQIADRIAAGERTRAQPLRRATGGLFRQPARAA